MPYRRRKNFRGRRGYRRKFRRGARRIGYRRPRVSKPSALVYNPRNSLTTFMPDRYFTKQRYNFYGTGNFTSGFAQFNFALNSIFDVGFTGDNKSVLGYSQMMALYSKWRVHKSSIRVDFCSGSAPGSGNISNSVVVIPSNDAKTLPTGNIADLISQPYAKHRMVSLNTGTPRTTIVHSMSVKRLAGLQSIMNEDSYVGQVTTPPTSIQDWFIMAYNPAGGSDAVALNVTVTYWVEYFGRLQSVVQPS